MLVVLFEVGLKISNRGPMRTYSFEMVQDRLVFQFFFADALCSEAFQVDGGEKVVGEVVGENGGGL